MPFRCPRCQRDYQGDPRLPAMFQSCPHCGANLLKQMCRRIVIPLRSAACAEAGQAKSDAGDSARLLA